ncbi:urease accessory protein UreE [uncultured Alistipes sp.]|jgi:urease accessory protein|uniref:urease accessory protein UreE n=1 Tax=uncultured Alistipes sp. TaxID=538949 RepID=UPI00262B0DAF|nr:urease accessory protein UreE [uncultured Alistipes sp.]
MEIFTAILGNLHREPWKSRAEGAETEYIDLDQWTAQKSRFTARGDRGGDYAVALARRTQLLDGDVVGYDPEARRIVAVRIRLSDVLVIDLSGLERLEPRRIARAAVELGHALGNQHWPAVVREDCVYVPLTVDRKVMLSVMRTHRLEHIAYSFRSGEEVIPYLAPHEVRRLFGGAEAGAHAHHHVHEHECERAVGH